MPIKKDREDYRFYAIWADMKYRCSNPNCKKYHLYGGRGIKVSESWINYANFYNDMWKSYQEHCEEFGIKDTTIDRINPDLGYSVENCRWATNKEQRINIRDKSFYRGYDIENKKEYIFNNCADFCKDYGFDRRQVFRAIKNNKIYKGFIFTRLSKEESKNAVIKLPD